MRLENYIQNISDFQGECNCISQDNNHDEGHFRSRGCDINHPDSNLGNTVYDVSGYNPITKEVENLGSICAECLCYIANGDIPEFIN
jgi:hypothetical protein